jgi:hypothetical protein
MNKQLLKPQIAQAMEINIIDDNLVIQCKSGSVALNMTCIASGYTQETLADLIGKPREVLSRACNGRGGLDVDVLISLMRESGSAFILQYMAKELGFVLKPNAIAEKKAALLAELAELEKAA